MADFKTQLLNVLAEIKGSGSFVVNDTKSFTFPGLEIKGVDEIGFPINANQAKEIIKAAHKAPFGKGGETVLDATVRSAWEIDADRISFTSKGWEKLIEGIIEQIKPALGIESNSVTANLYKMLIYETGDFFVAHKDSEKEKGMFGTLIIGLPSKHTGGELAVRFDGREEIIDFSGPAAQYKIPFAAFYADCEHEIKPLTSGFRVCLVYNLIQNKGEEKIKIDPTGGYAKKLAELLKAHEDDSNIPKIVLLGHQYTPSNFTMEALKLNDRPKAEALIQAAQIAGFYVKLGLVTSYQIGELVAGSTPSSRKNYRSRYYDDYGDEDLEENGVMGEVYDEDINVKHWMDDGVPPLRNIECKEEDLIAAITLNADDPIEKEAESYTGNAGMEMQYWYHYGAVFLWPKKRQYDMLVNLNPSNKLEWIAYYNKNWQSLAAADVALAKQLAEACMQVKEWHNPDFSALVGWLVNINDPEYLVEKATFFLTTHFLKFTVEGWTKLFEAYPPNYFENLFSTVALQGEPAVIEHILAVLIQLNSNNSRKYEIFISNQLTQMPAWLNGAKLSDVDVKAAVKNILQNVLVFEKLKQGDNVWQKSIAAAFTRELNREYVNDVLVATIMKFGERTPITNLIIAVCIKDLTHRVDNKPQPPADWSRPVPENARDKKVWDILKGFLQSPSMQIFEYRKAQGERSEMENAIHRVVIDLKMETIKKGTPHTLRLTKTQATYERELAKWKTDVDLLKKAEG